MALINPLFPIPLDGTGVIALGVLFAGDKLTVFTEFNQKLAAALGTFLGKLLKNRHLGAINRLGRLLELLGKGLIKLADHRYPLDLPVSNIIELLLELGGKVNVDNPRKVLNQKIVNDNPDIPGL